VLAGQIDVAALPPSQQRALLDELVRGKVPLFAADPRNPEGPSRLRFAALASAELEERLAVEQRRCDRQRAAYLEAQQLLAAAGIPLVLFKTLGPYPYTASNVDALVPRGELERAAQVLERAGHLEMVHYWEPYKRLFRRFDGAQCSLILHLHEQIGWIVLAFGDMEGLWASVRPGSDPFVTRPASEHVVAALLAHSVYEARRVQLGELWTVRSALAEPGFDWSQVERIARERSWLPGLELACTWYAACERLAFGSSLLASRAGGTSRLHARIEASERAGEWPLALPKRPLQVYFLRKLIVDNPRSAAQKLGDLHGLARQLVWGRLRARRRPTTFVCICGLDGAGKTTQAEALRAALEECEIPARRIWQRGGYSRPLEWLKSLARGASSSVPSIDDSAAKARAYRRPLVSSAWAWIIAFEQIAAAWLAVGTARLLGQAAVGERYLPDTVAELSERFGDPQYASSAPARLMCSLVPRPDLILWLDLPAERAFARKADWPVEVLEARRMLYHRALDRFASVETLDATRPARDLEGEVVDRVLRIVLGRIRDQNPLSAQSRIGYESR
jgi:thymidylate kinase